MSPFNKDFKPKVNLDDVIKDNKMSRIRTKQRATAMASADEQVRKAAKGTLSALSKRSGKKA